MLAGAALLAGAIVVSRRLSAGPFDYMALWIPRGKRDPKPIVLRFINEDRRISIADAKGLYDDLWSALDNAVEEGLMPSFEGLSGAVKVCVNYYRAPSGKIRCKQWSSGAGFTPGPQPEPEYFIQDVRDHYARALCADPRNKRKCGLSRKYHYRQSLPYIPRERAKTNAQLPRVARTGAVRILTVPPATPVKSRSGVVVPITAKH